MNFPEKVTVTYLGYYPDKKYTDGVEYRYDKGEWNDYSVYTADLKRDSGSLSSAERVDLEVNAGDHSKYITVEVIKRANPYMLIRLHMKISRLAQQ